MYINNKNFAVMQNTPPKVCLKGILVEKINKETKKIEKQSKD